MLLRRRWLVPFALLLGCGTPEAAPVESCSNGLCGGGGSTAAGTGQTTSTGATVSGASSTGTGGCVEAWTCTDWTKGGDDQYSRTCTDGSACGTTAQKPAEGPVALPDLDLEFYKCKVEPIVDRGCSMLGCHGTEVGRPYKVYARGRLRHKEVVAQVGSCPVGPQQIDLAAEGTGTVMCIGWSPHTQAEWQQNFDSARYFMLGVASPDDSELLVQPVVGGKAHAGVHLFQKTDPDYQTIAAWLGGAKLGSACDPGPN